MKENIKVLYFFSVFLILPLSLWSWDKKDSEGFVQPGRRISSSILLSEDQISYSYRTFKVRITDKVFKMDVKIDNSPTDLDIYINYNREILNYDDVDYSSTEELYNEKFSLTRMSPYPLENGVYYIDVVYPLERLPLIDDRESTRIPFGVTVKLTSIDNPLVLKPGEPVQSSLSSETSLFRLFAVDVEPGESSLRLDLYDAESDLDMYVSYGKPAYTPEQADYAREGYLGQESLIITKNSPRPLRSGRYYISVFDRIESDLTERFSLSAVFSQETPPQLTSYPPLPQPATELERAVAATVEISTDTGAGSGCLVSSRGHIVTGRHVITGTSGEVPEFVYVSMTLSPLHPARELFKARVIDVRKEEDLAFLQIETGLYGQPLPEDYAFPYFEIAWDKTVLLGQDLSFLGYPQIGGEGSRVSISLTRGIVSGFNSTDYGYLIKTDGEINSGNSGGAAFDEENRLIGFPMSVISDEGGQIAYIHPVSLIPESWRRQIDASRR